MYTLNLITYSGETFLRDIYFECQDGTPFSLEGVMPKAQIRKFRNSPEIIQEFICTLNTEDNYIHLELTQDQTRSMESGEYYYDLALTQDYCVTYYLSGKLTIKKPITEVKND